MHESVLHYNYTLGTGLSRLSKVTYNEWTVEWDFITVWSKLSSSITIITNKMTLAVVHFSDNSDKVRAMSCQYK